MLRYLILILVQDCCYIVGGERWWHCADVNSYQTMSWLEILTRDPPAGTGLCAGALPHSGDFLGLSGLHRASPTSHLIGWWSNHYNKMTTIKTEVKDVECWSSCWLASGDTLSCSGSFSSCKLNLGNLHICIIASLCSAVVVSWRLLSRRGLQN